MHSMKQKAFFSIIYENDHIIAVNKAAGIAVSADRWDDSKERLDKVLEVFLNEGEGGPATGSVPAAPHHRLYTVHRIDRDTSGVVVFARDEETHRLLSRAFEDRQVKKRYYAVVHGRPGWKEAACDLPLVPNGNKQHMTIIDKYQGKKSLTKFRLLGSAGNYSVVEALPETGRTHQIRVHLCSMGHPIVCDPLYGSAKPVLLSSFKRNWRGDPFDEKPLLARLGLHAAELILPDYGNGATEGGSAENGGIALRAPLSRDMAALIKQMEKHVKESFLKDSPNFDEGDTGEGPS
ncbi:RNA pseudouridine synthase [Spirochaetia bacterium]|nr:RNA pseudouridine synthase [Spirochaetia bacterium]